MSIVAAVVGFGGTASNASWIPQGLFFVFMIAALVALALGIRNHDR